MEFRGFGKIYRLSRECVITEKIDGTNAQVYITWCPKSNGQMEPTDDRQGVCVWSAPRGEWFELRAGSRTRWITPGDDNYGFARWTWAHAQELVDGLGRGQHFGEWWGCGIQRSYELTEKRFSLFNVGVWGPGGTREAERPACCGVVPVLWRGEFTTDAVRGELERLEAGGSVAAPGFMRPEGVVVFHVPSGVLFKKTLEKDSAPKGQSR